MLDACHEWHPYGFTYTLRAFPKRFLSKTRYPILPTHSTSVLFQRDAFLALHTSFSTRNVRLSTRKAKSFEKRSHKTPFAFFLSLFSFPFSLSIDYPRAVQ